MLCMNNVLLDEGQDRLAVAREVSMLLDALLSLLQPHERTLMFTSVHITNTTSGVSCCQDTSLGLPIFPRVSHVPNYLLEFLDHEVSKPQRLVAVSHLEVNPAQVRINCSREYSLP